MILTSSGVVGFWFSDWVWLWFCNLGLSVFVVLLFGFWYLGFWVLGCLVSGFQTVSVVGLEMLVVLV